MAEIRWQSPDAGGSTQKMKDPYPTTAKPPGGGRNQRIEGWRTEIADYFQTMKEFNNMDPSDVFRSLSAFSARATEMRTLLGEHETRAEASFRTRVIDPFLDECDRQFKIHSRTLATDEMNARLTGGRYA